MLVLSLDMQCICLALSLHMSPPRPLIRRERKSEDGLFSPGAKRARLSPPLSQRVMLYVRQEREELYTPLHVVPPTTIGLLHAVS